MIQLDYVKDDFQIYSVTGRVEFIIFYHRIKYLVNFYNYTEESYLNLIKQKHRERKRIEDNMDEILSAAEEHDIDFTEEEAFIEEISANEIIVRIKQLSTDSQPRWGTMNVAFTIPNIMIVDPKTSYSCFGRGFTFVADVKTPPRLSPYLTT